jgi:hypothetical protein
MSFSYVCNTAWMMSCLPRALAFQHGSHRVEQIQAALLRRILRRNKDTWIGRRHRFASLQNAREFQDAVPLSTYDDYRGAIERIANGERGVLTSEPVRLLEPTGGSSGGLKLIPYTGSLQRSFQRAIGVWIWDLYRRRPQLRRGRAYWSISPLAARDRRTPSGIPIGFDNDAAYLSRWERAMVRYTMVAPPELALCRTVATAQYATLFFLLRAGDLSLISVWSPTFLTELLRLLWSHWERLCDDIAAGRLSFDDGQHECAVTDATYELDVQRAEYLRRMFARSSQISECIREIWPNLALVSCWTDGPSLIHANNLRQELAGIEIQGKGLLATEAFVTAPLVGCRSPALALNSHFFEFQPVSAAVCETDTQPLLAHQLAVGRRYEVIVTTDGGLYRYRLHDEVEVTGHLNEVPLLRYVGKTDNVSDVVGEKLNAAHVESVLQATYQELQLTPTFARLRVEHTSPPRYILQIAGPQLECNSLLQQRLRQVVETGLRQNVGYDYAVSLGQLHPLAVEIIDQRAVPIINSDRLQCGVAAGQRLGDIKPVTLSTSCIA